MSLLEKLMKASGKRKEVEEEGKEAKVKERLLSIVYDEELATELLPVFMKLQSVDGFNKVVELLETKERQIEAISGGEWFNKTADDEVVNKEVKTEEQEDDGETIDYVDLILKQKYTGEK